MTSRSRSRSPMLILSTRFANMSTEDMEVVTTLRMRQGHTRHAVQQQSVSMDVEVMPERRCADTEVDSKESGTEGDEGVPAWEWYWNRWWVWSEGEWWTKWRTLDSENEGSLAFEWLPWSSFGPVEIEKVTQ